MTERGKVRCGHIGCNEEAVKIPSIEIVGPWGVYGAEIDSGHPGAGGLCESCARRFNDEFQGTLEAMLSAISGREGHSGRSTGSASLVWETIQ